MSIGLDSLVDMPLDHHPDFVTLLLGEYITNLDLTFLPPTVVTGCGSSLWSIGMSWMNIIGGRLVEYLWATGRIEIHTVIVEVCLEVSLSKDLTGDQLTGNARAPRPSIARPVPVFAVLDDVATPRRRPLAMRDVEVAPSVARSKLLALWAVVLATISICHG